MNKRYYKFYGGSIRKDCYKDIVCVNFESRVESKTMFDIHIITQIDNNESHFIIPSRTIRFAKKEVDKFVRDIEKTLSIVQKENDEPNCLMSSVER